MLSQHASNPTAANHLIVVMGVSGSGKSTLAATLAAHYGYSYLDADDFHSQVARDRMAQGLPLTDDMRLPWVMRIQAYLRNTAANQSHSVLAFSGLRKQHREYLRNAGYKTIFLFLQSDKNSIRERINNRTDHFMAPVLLDSQFDSLEDPHNEYDVFTLDATANAMQVAIQARAIIAREIIT